MIDDSSALCRSKSPDGDRCIKIRSHKKQEHKGEGERRWTAEINSPARWRTTLTYDPYDISEGERQAMSSFGMGSRAPWGW